MNDPEHHAPQLGIDIGRVIIGGPTRGSADTGFFQGSEDQLLATPEITGSMEAIGRLNLLAFGRGNVWLVSKCGPRIQARTLRWLDGHDFWSRTNIQPDNVRFCRQRPEKRDICAELGITHFVDDRIDVLAAMYGAVPHRYLFGPQSQRARGGLLAVSDWPAAEAAIREDYPR